MSPAGRRRDIARDRFALALSLEAVAADQAFD